MNWNRTRTMRRQLRATVDRVAPDPVTGRAQWVASAHRWSTTENQYVVAFETVGETQRQALTRLRQLVRNS